MRNPSFIVAGLIALAACKGSTDSGAAPNACADAGDDVPDTLACTGLYADIASKALSAGARPYTPANALWADGADKNRWIALPAGTQIDRTKPNDWVFPVGTQVWKEFARNGKVVETRYFKKTRPTLWVRATYAWSADGTQATRSAGGDISVDGSPYHVPAPDECDKCHKGRLDRLLGFEETSLGLAGATGLTLAALAGENLLNPPPARTTLTIGDDGTGTAPAALAWLNVNCGITCHNATPGSTANGAGLRLRLDATLLDGRSSAAFEALTTTLNVTATTPAFSGRMRIVPGDPDSSLLVDLISHRGDKEQMPPIASNVVDTTNVAVIADWVRRMAHAPDGGVPDGGPVDAGPDVSTDAATDASADATVDATDAGIDADDADMLDGADDAGDAD